MNLDLIVVSIADEEDSIEDNRLRLIFTCCHPSLVLEARDLNHAIQLISQHPGGSGPFEIRPAADLNEMIKESEQRRRKDTLR